jgi:hypothetical protein
MRLAASFDSRPATHAAGRTVGEILDSWVEVNQEVWAESSRRDQGGRVGKVLADPIASVPVSRLGVADVERSHARMRRAGGETAIRSRHSVLRAALAQAARWEWITTNPAAAARPAEPGAHRLVVEPGPRWRSPSIEITGATSQPWGRLVDVSIGEELIEERRRRRRAGDPRITEEGRAILLRLVEGDLMGEFQAELDRVSAEDPDVGGVPDSTD